MYAAELRRGATAPPRKSNPVSDVSQQQQGGQMQLVMESHLGVVGEKWVIKAVFRAGGTGDGVIF